jgi:hypothetical protein
VVEWTWRFVISSPEYGQEASWLPRPKTEAITELLACRERPSRCVFQRQRLRISFPGCGQAVFVAATP